MSESASSAGEEFGVELQWPRGGVLPADLTPPATGDTALESDDAGHDFSDQTDVAVLRRLLDDYLARRSDELARMNGVLKQLRTGIDDAAAALHRLAASTAALSGEVTALSHRVDEGLGAVRAEIAQVAGEVSAVRRRTPVSGRDAAAHR